MDDENEINDTPPNKLFSLKADKSTTAFLRNLVLYEEIDINRIMALKVGDNLLTDWGDDDENDIEYSNKTTQHENEIQQLARYALNNKQGLGIEVKYKMGGKDHTDYGRTYPLKSLGLTCLRSKIRNTLSHDVYADFDIKNAQPAIMCILAEHHKLSNTCLKEYCNRREEILIEQSNHYGVSKRDIKKLFIQSLFCGGFKSWAVGVGLDEKTKPTPFVDNFKREINSICEIVNSNNKHTGGIYALRKRAKNPNLDASAFAVFNQHLETSILAKVIETLMNTTTLFRHNKKKDLFTGTYEYDGIRLLIKNVNAFKHEGEVGAEAVVKYLNKITLEETGYALNWCNKKCDEETLIDYKDSLDDVEALNESVKEDIKYIKDLSQKSHQGCVNLINEKYKEFITYSTQDKCFYCWNENILRYEANDFPIRDKIKTIAIKKLQDMVDKYESVDEAKRTKAMGFLLFDLGQMLKAYNSASYKDDVVKLTKTDNRCDDFLRDDKMFLLGFDNGVLDIENKVFRKHSPSDRITMSCGYNFDTAYLPDDYIVNKVENDTSISSIDTKEAVATKRKKVMELLMKIQPIEDELEYFLKIHATALTGKPIEKAFILNGNGRNGKGVFSSLMSAMLGQYASVSVRHEVITDNSKQSSNGATESLTPLRYVRYAVMKEPPKTSKINNAKMKTLTGGDPIPYRPLYGKESFIIPTWTLFLEVNIRLYFADTPTTAEYERVRDIYFPNKFVNKEKVDEKNGFYAVDTQLKDTTFLNEHRHALLSILLDYLPQLFKDEFNVDSNTPKAVITRTDAYLRESNSILDMIRQNYKIDLELTTKEAVKYKDIVNTILMSKQYEKLTKLEKREITSASIKQVLETEDFFKDARVEDKKNHAHKIKLIKIYDDEQSDEDDDEEA